jgi:hypothetical protein
LYGGRPHGGAIISELLEQDRQGGFGIFGQRPEFVRSSTLQGRVIALSSVDENRDHGTSLGRIELGDSRHHPDQRVL